MGEANAHAEGAGRHRTIIGFRTEACEPGQNRRLPHWAFGKSPHDATSVAVPLLSPFRGAVSACAKYRIRAYILIGVQGTLFIRGGTAGTAGRQPDGLQAQHLPDVQKRLHRRKREEHERKGARWTTAGSCFALSGRSASTAAAVQPKRRQDAQARNVPYGHTDRRGRRRHSGERAGARFKSQ